MKLIVYTLYFLVFTAAKSLAFTPAVATLTKATGILQTPSALFAAPVGPLALAKKAMDPKEYSRVVGERMKKSGMSRAEAEADYNSFLENPPFYYALEKKVSARFNAGIQSFLMNRLSSQFYSTLSKL
jgi:hypothetical protein